MAETTIANTQLIVVDTDAGVDDACALLLLLSKHRQSLQLLGITTVHGNAGADQVCLNVLRILQITDNMDVNILITLI